MTETPPVAALQSSPWVTPAYAALFAPVAAELDALPGWARDEPEWVRIGMVHADVLRVARRQTAGRFGLHAYARLIRAAIIDPAAIAAAIAALAVPYRPAALAAAHLQARRNLSDLALLLEYLAQCSGACAEDLHDLVGLWGSVDERVAVLIDLCNAPAPGVAETALRTLTSVGMRPFVGGAELDRLGHALATGPHGALLSMFRAEFAAPLAERR